MKENELRIGNYILFPIRTDKGLLLPAIKRRVDAIDCGKVISLNSPQAPSDFEVYVKNCTGIQITKEILLKIGFVEGNQCYKNAFSIEILKTDFYLRRCSHDGFYWGFNVSEKQLDCELNDVQPIKYVHELQNLYFALTGKELDIKIKYHE